MTLRCLLACLVLVGPLVGPLRAADITRQDDAFHFSAYAGGPNAASYAEWWYFNLFDSSQALQLAVTYSVLDPANLSGFGAASVTAIAYTSAGNVAQTSTYGVDAFHASAAEADVLIAAASPAAPSFVQVLSDDAYRIVGAVEGTHSVRWNLVYIRRAQPWLGADRAPVGVLPWEEMSWLQYMPGATVAGEVVVDGVVYQVRNTRGYHDHNWGEWLPFTVTWNWAQYSEPGFDFSIGDFRNSGTGVVSVEQLGHRVTFAKNQYRLFHEGWVYDPANLTWFPTTTWLYAQNDDCALIVRLEALDTVPVLPPPEIPSPLIPVIYEQTSRISGWIWAKNAAGIWQLVRVFGGGGFKEYTDITIAQSR